MFKLLGSFALGICLLTPVGVLNAQDQADHGRSEHAETTRQAHQWNDSENTYWHQYLKEHHKKDKDWARASKREHNAYWKWRDQHRDER